MHSMLAVDETEPPAGLHDSIMERLRQEETVRVVAPQSRCAVAGVYDGGRCGGCRAGRARRRTDARVQHGRQRQYGRQRIPLRRTQETARRTAVCRMKLSGPCGRTPMHRAAEHRIRACSRAARLRRARTAAHTADRMTPAKTLRRIRRAMRASMPEQYADSERSIAAPEPIADESVQTQVQSRPVLTLPQSLHGAHTAYCYVAVGGSSLPDIDGDCSRRRTAFRGSGWTTVWKRSKRLCRQ